MNQETIKNIAEITHDEIDYLKLTEEIRSNQAGAAILFLGTVREFSDGQQTVALDYEAYPEMAIAKMKELIEQARSKWSVVHAGIIHRLGHLELGDISVAVAISTPHRKESFEAGQYLIDQLKICVPVWKKENWSDGTTEWVDPTGEDSIPSGQS